MNCKLTNGEGYTRKRIRCAPGRTSRVKGELIMCHNGLHFYQHPLLATFFSPIHGNEYKALWSGVPSGEIIHDNQVKSVCQKWTTTERIDLPEISMIQRTEISIRIALLVFGNNDDFVEWAGRWLSGEDRSESAARSAAWSAAWSAARSAARSAAWSAESAARSAAWSAAGNAAWSAAWSAAESAARSAESAAEIDILAVIKEVIGDTT